MKPRLVTNHKTHSEHQTHVRTHGRCEALARKPVTTYPAFDPVPLQPPHNTEFLSRHPTFHALFELGSPVIVENVCPGKTHGQLEEDPYLKCTIKF